MEIYIENVPKEPLRVCIAVVPESIEKHFLRDEFLKTIEKKVAGIVMEHDTDYAKLKSYSIKLIKDNERLEFDRNYQGFMSKQFQNRLIELMGFEAFSKFEKACFALMRQQDWYSELKETKISKHL